MDLSLKSADDVVPYRNAPLEPHGLEQLEWKEIMKTQLRNAV